MNLQYAVLIIHVESRKKRLSRDVFLVHPCEVDKLMYFNDGAFTKTHPPIILFQLDLSHDKKKNPEYGTQMPELIDLITKEHDHLSRFFADLNTRFYDLENESIDADFLENTRCDLEFGIEEMLHHFDQEEEVLFIEIVKRLPEEKEKVQKLIRMHEFICDQTRDLQQVLQSTVDELPEQIPYIHDLVSTIRGALRTHARQEDVFFHRIFENLNATDSAWLLTEIAKI